MPFWDLLDQWFGLVGSKYFSSKYLLMWLVVLKPFSKNITYVIQKWHFKSNTWTGYI